MQERKLAFWGTCIAGMAIHAYRLCNYQATWDSLYNYTGVGATLTNGRWFLGYLGRLSSDYDLSLVNGLLSILCLAVVAVLLVDLFCIHNKVAIILLGILLTGFPTVTGCFTYMYTADCYMVSFLLAVLSVYCGAKWKWGFFLGAVCMCFSVGIYQAYIATAVVMCILVVLDRILFVEINTKQLLILCVRLIATLGLGMLFYQIMLKWCLKGLPLIGYMGINTVGVLTPSEYLDSIYVSWANFKAFFHLDQTFVQPEGETVVSYYWGLVYGYANKLIIAIGLILIGYVIVSRHVYKKPFQLFMVVAGVLIFPFACFIINFATTVRGYHTLMMMALFFVYFAVGLIAYRVMTQIDRKKWTTAFAVLCTGLLVVVGYLNVLNTNICYYRQQLAWEKTYAISSNILSRIQEMPEYGANFSVLLFGEYNSYVFLDKTYPSIIGVTEDSILNDMYHYINIWRQFEGSYAGTIAGNDGPAETIRQTEEFMEMPCYPAKGCVRVINGIFTVKLSE